jgi:hypothetical protein
MTEVSYITSDSPMSFEKTVLWQYLDLAKLLSLFQRRELYLCRGDKFDDPFEGSYPLKNRDALEGDGIRLSKKEYKKYVAISCWHMPENPNEESDAMWRLYCPKGQGIAIQTSMADLTKALGGRCYLEKVEYIDFIEDEAKIDFLCDVFNLKTAVDGRRGVVCD